LQYSYLLAEGAIDEYKVLILKNFQRNVPVDLERLDYLILGLERNFDFSDNLSVFFGIKQVVPINIKNRGQDQGQSSGGESVGDAGASSNLFGEDSDADDGFVWGGLTLSFAIKYSF
jgi:hypothetical protein